MSSPIDRSTKDKAINFLINSRWVLKVSWDTSPGLLLGVVFCKVLNSGMPAALAWVGRCLINAVVDASKGGIISLDPILPWIIYSFCLVLAGESIGIISQFFERRLDEKLHLKIDLDQLEHAAKLDVSWFEDPYFQDVAERAQRNASAHFTGFLQKTINLAANILKCIGLVLILFAIDPIIVLVSVPIVFPFMLFKWHQSKARFNKEYSRATKRRWRSYFVSMLTSQHSVAEIKLLALAPLLINRFRVLAIEFLKEDRKIYTRGFIGNFVFSVIFAVIFYILFGRIAQGVLSGSLTVGDVVLFAGAIGALRGLLNSIAAQASGAVEDTLYVDNLAKFLSVEPVIQKTSGKTFTSSQGEIEIRNLSFAYPGSKRNVLHNISLRIKPGEIIALVGKNGAGKTTLIKLIARLYEPDKGSIMFDGVNLRELSLDYLHREISFVFQRSNRYEATVSDNIAYGDWEHVTTGDQVKRVGRLANVDDMIMAMPEGYKTMLGRRFGEYDLSGGQWRKISIARAMARDNSSLLILDEPTAGLDAQAEYDLFCRFKDLAVSRTTILISQRFSTVRLAQRIIVMDQGRIVESGTHDELTAKAGHYATLYDVHQRQMGFSRNGKRND